MGLASTYLDGWQYFDGTTAGDGAPAFTIFHLSDLHGQLGPNHQVYYDNPQSRPTIDFGEADRAIRSVRGLATHVGKIDQLRSERETLVLMSGDTFHGTAETTYTEGGVM